MANHKRAPGRADESLKTFFPFFLPSLPLFTYLHADGVFSDWMGELPQCCSHTLPFLGYFGMLEKVWLTPGRNPLATAIYREDTHSHICIWSLWERKMAKEAWRIQSIFEINNLSRNPSYFFSGQIKEERRGKKRRQECKNDFVQIFFFCPKVKKNYLEIRQADPNWIKSI